VRLRGSPGFVKARRQKPPLLSWDAVDGWRARRIGFRHAFLLGSRLWRGWLVGREPLLWILHVALAWIPVALVLLAAASVGAVTPTAWLHAAGAGAAGALVLGVMSRVALGHTGRPLHLPPGMTLAFAAVLGAGALRVATALAWVPRTSGLLASGVLWVLAYGTFVTRYAPMLAAPRPDGRPWVRRADRFRARAIAPVGLVLRAKLGVQAGNLGNTLDQERAARGALKFIEA
jgi:uncharacterized protein involved in response to NO